MTTFIGYVEIRNQLNNGTWSTIAKPGFEDGKKSSQFNRNTIKIKLFPSIAKPVTTGANSRDEIQTQWEMQLIAENKVDCDLYLNECRTIINYYDLANGVWHIDSWELLESGGLFYYDCKCSENLWDLA